PGALFSPWSEDQGYSKVLDLAGNARIFIYGPYLHLPRGNWVATPAFSIGNNDSGNTLIIDIFNGSVLAIGESILPARGTYTCSIPFEITDPQSPIEVRFATAQGAIEGVFSLEEVVIERA